MGNKNFLNMVKYTEAHREERRTCNRKLKRTDPSISWILPFAELYWEWAVYSFLTQSSVPRVRENKIPMK